MGEKYVGTCGEMIDEVPGRKNRALRCPQRPGIISSTSIEDTTREEAIEQMCRRCPILRPGRHVFLIDLVLKDSDLMDGLQTEMDSHVLCKVPDIDEATDIFEKLKKLPTVNQVRAKMKELAKMALVIPEEVEEGGEHAWRAFCRGGISACRWIIGEADGEPGHELDYIDDKDLEQ